jgi:hypothetical protein
VKLAIGVGNAGGVLSTSTGRSAMGTGRATGALGAGLAAAGLGAGFATGFATAFGAALAALAFAALAEIGFDFNDLGFVFARAALAAAGFFFSGLRDFVALPIAGHANVYEPPVSNTTDSCANRS